MDTSKVIELGKVSEKTEGHSGNIEGVDTTSGPHVG